MRFPSLLQDFRARVEERNPMTQVQCLGHGNSADRLIAARSYFTNLRPTPKD